MHRTVAIASALVAAVLASCGGGSCPACPQASLPSGTFQSAPALSGGVLFGHDPAAFPWGAEPKNLEVDVANRTTRLTYVRDGHTVVVTWRIRSLTDCPNP